MATKYQHKDTLGNTDTLMVRDDGVVVMWTQTGAPMCLSNVGYMLPGSYDEKRRAVKLAARAGLQELIRVTQLPWEQVQ